MTLQYLDYPHAIIKVLIQGNRAEADYRGSNMTEGKQQDRRQTTGRKRFEEAVLQTLKGERGP